MHCNWCSCLTSQPTHLRIWPDGGASSLLHCCLVHCCCWDEASVAWQVAARAGGTLVQVPASSNTTRKQQAVAAGCRGLDGMTMR
jgi:hypothetical protein